MRTTSHQELLSIFEIRTYQRIVVSFEEFVEPSEILDLGEVFVLAVLCFDGFVVNGVVCKYIKKGVEVPYIDVLFGRLIDI